MNTYNIIVGDSLEKLKEMPDESINCCVTSPPYFNLRDYGMEGQYGLEKTPKEYIDNMVNVFREVKRVLKNDGTFWLNIGDSYANQKNGNIYKGFNARYSGCKFDPESKQSKTFDGFNHTKIDYGNIKQKDLIGIPWMLALALREDGWYLRQDIIYYKKNPIPESVTDRCTKSHEYLFLLTKQPSYYFDHLSIKESATYAGKSRGGSTNRYEQNNAGMDRKVYDTRNKRSVWEVVPDRCIKKHFAVFPMKLIEPCILAGCPKDGIVLDPFCGAGTTLLVSLLNGRNSVGIELNPEYEKLAKERIEEYLANQEKLKVKNERKKKKNFDGD